MTEINKITQQDYDVIRHNPLDFAGMTHDFLHYSDERHGECAETKKNIYHLIELVESGKQLDVLREAAMKDLQPILDGLLEDYFPSQALKVLRNSYTMIVTGLMGRNIPSVVNFYDRAGQEVANKLVQEERAFYFAERNEKYINWMRDADTEKTYSAQEFIDVFQSVAELMEELSQVENHTVQLKIVMERQIIDLYLHDETLQENLYSLLHNIDLSLQGYPYPIQLTVFGMYSSIIENIVKTFE